MKDPHPQWTPQANREQHYRSPAFEPPRGGEGFEASAERQWRDRRETWQGERGGRDGDPYASGQRGFQQDPDRYHDAYQDDRHAGAAPESWGESRGWNPRAQESGEGARWQSDYGPYASREPYPPHDRGNRHPGMVGNWQDELGSRGGETRGYGYAARSQDSGWQRSMAPRFGEYERSPGRGHPDEGYRRDSGAYGDQGHRDAYAQRGFASHGEHDGGPGGHAGHYGAGTGMGSQYEHGYGGVSRDMAAWGGPEYSRGMSSGAPRPGRGPKGYTRSDERIREDICERLMQESRVDVGEVSVDVQDGTVQLAGQVEERWMKHRIEDVADGCSGVKDVRNQIEVGSRDREARPGTTQESATKQSGTQESGSRPSVNNGHSKRATMGGGKD